MRRGESQSRGLLLIAGFKLFKGLVLLGLAVGALKLLHKDVAAEAERWIEFLRVDAHNHYIHRLLEKLSILDARRLKELSVGTFFYSALFLTEGIGLALAKRWAEYFTVVSTSLFIPLEVYELAKHASIAKGVLVLVNAGIVAYLVREIRRDPKAEVEVTSSHKDESHVKDTTG
jgi:uncharacterized membrane protein (DUF2068 family)